MMMYLLLRTFHKMADLHGLTTFLQLPHCDESDLEDDREPIVEGKREDQAAPCQTEKEASKHLKPGSQSTYNTIHSGWAGGEGEKKKQLYLWYLLTLVGWIWILVLIFFTSCLLYPEARASYNEELRWVLRFSLCERTANKFVSGYYTPLSAHMKGLSYLDYGDPPGLSDAITDSDNAAFAVLGCCVYSLGLTHG